MEYLYDKLYGGFFVEDVLGELIRSTPMQRLKGIHQAGPAYLVNPKWSVTRFEHSIGVMLLTKKLGGSLQEQIAALLHDVSHTTFSHVIDLALNNRTEDFHEKWVEKVIMDSEIPTILKRHQLDSRNIVRREYALLDAKLPLLSTDRIDYTLRDMMTYGETSSAACQNFVASLKVSSGKIVVHSLEMAEWFVDMYKREVIDFFYHPLNVFSYEWISRILKYAFQAEILVISDLFETDQIVVEKLKAANNDTINQLFKQLTQAKSFKQDPFDYDIHQKKKLRLVDPLIMENGKLRQVSEISAVVRERNEQIFKVSSEGIFLKIFFDNSQKQSDFCN